MVTKARATVTLEQFSKDLWEVWRDELRAELGLPDDEFDARIMPWEQLSEEARGEKMRIARNEMLRLLDKAGYEVRKKQSQ